MIEVKARTKIGAFHLFSELNDEGFICLLGRNGSGKSSLLRAIAGQLAVDEGSVKVGGVDVTRLPPERRGIVMVTPSTSIPHLTVDAHLRWGAKVRGFSLDEKRVSTVKEALGIGFGGRVRTLSLGLKERVALATAVLSSPRAILVDEAFSNLHDRRGFVSSYRGLARSAGADVIFSTQDESDSSLSDHAYVISDGRTQRLF